MTIYYVNNTSFDDNDDEENPEYIEDAYYIQPGPFCNKIDCFVALFNITLTTLIFYYLSSN